MCSESQLSAQQIGEKWLVDSRLETWFPLTSEELNAAKKRIVELEQQLRAEQQMTRSVFKSATETERELKTTLKDVRAGAEMRFAELEKERDDARAMFATEHEQYLISLKNLFDLRDFLTGDPPHEYQLHVRVMAEEILKRFHAEKQEAIQVCGEKLRAMEIEKDLLEARVRGLLTFSDLAENSRMKLFAALKQIANDAQKAIEGIDLTPKKDDPDLVEIKEGHVCKHGVRWPHRCDPCSEDLEALKNLNLKPRGHPHYE